METGYATSRNWAYIDQMKKEDIRAKLLKEYPHLNEFFPFLDQFNEESPRGAVLIACSYIEEQLRRIILNFLIEAPESDKLLEDHNAPLGTFYARATAAFCFGLISTEEYQDCNILRRIRNEFAHSFSITFENQKITDLCKNLHFSAKDYGDVVVGPFGQFSTASIALISSFTNRPHYVKAYRASYHQWPD